jgi:hypothetical protein
MLGIAPILIVAFVLLIVAGWVLIMIVCDVKRIYLLWKRKNTHEHRK